MLIFFESHMTPMAVNISLLGIGFLLVGILALLLESAELGEVGLLLIAQAAILEGEVVEIATIREEDLTLDESFADGGVGFLRMEIGEFEAANGVDAGFERSDAVDAPFGIGNALDEIALLRRDR